MLSHRAGCQSLSSAWMQPKTGTLIRMANLSCIRPSRGFVPVQLVPTRPACHMQAGGKSPAGPAVKSNSPGSPANPDNFFTQKEAPEAFLGPVMLVQSQGRGNGLGSTKTLNAGDLVLVSPPLAVVTEEDLDLEEAGDEDLLDLKFDVLQRRLLSKKYSEAELAWLHALSAAPDPDKEDGEDGSSREGPVPDLQTLITHQVPTGKQQVSVLPSSYADRIEGIIQANAYEAASEDTDLAYVATEADPRQEIMGLWPHYAMLNHSCMPNTITYCHQGMLITRASRANISKGAELTANYIGDLLLSPLDVRREALEDSYGFVCSCARCKTEERMGDDVSKLVADIYESCTEQVREELEEAIEEEDATALEGLRDQLAAFVEVLDAAFTKKKVPEQTQIWIQASLFELYELLYTTLEALGQSDMRLLELLQALAAETQPGSELHCYYSRSYLQAQQETAADGEGSNAAGKGAPPPVALGFGSGVGGASKHAQGLCSRAYTARYGALSRQVYQAILESRRRMEGEEEGEDEGAQ